MDVLVVVLAVLAGLALGWALATARAAARTTRLADERGRLAAALEHERARADETAQLGPLFRSLSAQALAANNEQFLALADTRLRQSQAVAAGELEQRRVAVEQLLEPLRHTLDRMTAQLVSAERTRAEAHAALVTEIDLVRRSSEQLRGETAALVNVLRRPQARGQWGELQLRRVVELAGMVERCDFDPQVSVRTADGLRRPDLVVRLAGGKHVVVDAKVSLAAFLEAAEAGDEAVAAERLAAHARHLREHVDALAGKEYWSAFQPAPEFVVLFVPGEAFLAPALEHDPALLEHAFAARVHIATPTTLISMLRTAAYGWQQAALSDNARAVLDLGKELHRRLGTLGGHVDRVGRALSRAVTSYNEAVGSLERSVLVPARRLRDLEVTDDDLAAPCPVEDAVRPLGAPELVADDETALVRLVGRDRGGGSASVG